MAPLPYCAPAPDHATGLSFNYRVREHHSPPCGGVAPLPYCAPAPDHATSFHSTTGCGSTTAPLVAAWRRCHIRGDWRRGAAAILRSRAQCLGSRSSLCLSEYNQLSFNYRVREHHSPPCGGVAPLPYQGGLAGWPRSHTALPAQCRDGRSSLCLSEYNQLSFSCRVRQHHSPPCAKGGQHGKAMQGGL